MQLRPFGLYPVTISTDNISGKYGRKMWIGLKQLSLDFSPEIPHTLLEYWNLIKIPEYLEQSNDY
jgi:hypothetical protein